MTVEEFETLPDELDERVPITSRPVHDTLRRQEVEVDRVPADTVQEFPPTGKSSS
jgi:hypothetical protein